MSVLWCPLNVFGTTVSKSERRRCAHLNSDTFDDNSSKRLLYRSPRKICGKLSNEKNGYKYL